MLLGYSYCDQAISAKPRTTSTASTLLRLSSEILITTPFSSRFAHNDYFSIAGGQARRYALRAAVGGRRRLRPLCSLRIHARLSEVEECGCLVSVSDVCLMLRSVTFRVGAEPVANFRMIERHFFKDKLLKSFDFDFGFCIPSSQNTCEHIYEFPELSDRESMLYRVFSNRTQSKRWLPDATSRALTASTLLMASLSCTTAPTTRTTTERPARPPWHDPIDISKYTHLHTILFSILID